MVSGMCICHHEGPMVPEGSTEHSKTLGFAWDLEISEPSWNTTYHNFLSVINWDDFCQMKTSYFGLHFPVFLYIFSRRHRAIFVCLGLRFLPFAGRFVLPGKKQYRFPNQQKKPPLKPTTTSTSGPIGSILFDSAWKVPKRLEGWLTFWRFPMGWLDDWRMVVLRRLSHQISNDLQMVFCSQNHHQSQAIAELFTMRVWEVVVIYQECLMLSAPQKTLAKIAKALISIHHYEDFFGIIFKQRDTCGPIFSKLLLELLFLELPATQNLFKRIWLERDKIS